MIFFFRKFFLHIPWTIMSYCLFFSVGVFAFSCQKNQQKISPPPSPLAFPFKTISTLGDPINLIKGAYNHPSTPWTKDTPLPFSNYYLISSVQFIEKESFSYSPDVSQTKKRNVENEETIQILSRNQFTNIWNSLLKNENIKYQFSTQNSQTWVLSNISSSDDQNQFFLEPDPKGFLQIVKIKSKGELFSVQPIHFSCTENCEMMSFLGYRKNEKSGKSLVAYYWKKDNSDNIGSHLIKTPKPARTDRVTWQLHSKLTVQLCGINLIPFKSQIIEGINSWSKILSHLNALDIEIEMNEKFPPFTDLNHHCVYLVDNYLLDTDENVISSGSTFRVYNLDSGYFQDADIFLFKSEWAKQKHSSEDSERLYLSKVIRHEFGHFLGLEHQFDQPSVMSYKEDEINLTLYDMLSLIGLYK